MPRCFSFDQLYFFHYMFVLLVSCPKYKHSWIDGLIIITTSKSNKYEYGKFANFLFLLCCNKEKVLNLFFFFVATSKRRKYFLCGTIYIFKNFNSSRRKWKRRKFFFSTPKKKKFWKKRTHMCMQFLLCRSPSIATPLLFFFLQLAPLPPPSKQWQLM